MAEDGEKKLIAVARHIAKTLGHTDTMIDDILHIFSNFDGRLREKLLQNLSNDDDPRAMERILDSLDRQISRYVSADHPIWSDSDDASAFLDAVDELISAVRNWTPMAGEMAVAACVDRAEDLLQQAMFQLEDEFRLLIERGGESSSHLTRSRNGESAVDHSFDSEEDEDGGMIRCGGDQQMQIPVAQPVTDYDVVIDPLPPGTVNDLHEIAKRMFAAGHGKECSLVYGCFRREFLEESLSRLGLEKVSIEEVQRIPWSDLEEGIERWIKAVNVSIRILFPSERRLCDRIFSGCSSVADLSFVEICRGPTIQILNFADAVAIGSQAPERLFKVLDVFETLGDLIPEFDALFSDQHCLFLRNEAITVWKRLGEAIRGIFVRLENLIRRDPAKAVVPGGGLHPITRYVMNYLRAACRSRRTLEQVFDETLAAPPDSRSFCSSLSVQMAWIMELLETNLESKSNVYRDSALCSVFLMNNGRYLVQKAKDSELGSLLGDDWIRKHNAMVRQHHLNYQRSSWRKALGVLNHDSSSLKEKLKLFNHHFEDVCKNQTTWVIFDDQLREELRISVAGNLSPAYRNFLGRLQDSGKHEKHVKYSVEELEARINLLFQGSGRK